MKSNFLKLVRIVFLIIVCVNFAQAQETVIYKKIDTVQLSMEILYPPQMDKRTTYPAMIFFFGGGWKGGTIEQFRPQATYFAKRGIVCFLADYRTSGKHGTTPFESLKDAKSAIRYLRVNAEKFSIDPDKIVASGGSAGGHLAAATALIEDYNDSDNLGQSAVPNALVLFNPVIDNGPGGYGYERIGNLYKSFSPLHNINNGAPPTLFFLGSKDQLIPVETAKYYKTVMENVGSRCDLSLYEGAGHGFFNYRTFEYYKSTVETMDDFLVSLGFLANLPEVEIK